MDREIYEETIRELSSDEHGVGECLLSCNCIVVGCKQAVGSLALSASVNPIVCPYCRKENVVTVWLQGYHPWPEADDAPLTDDK